MLTRICHSATDECMISSRAGLPILSANALKSRVEHLKDPHVWWSSPQCYSVFAPRSPHSQAVFWQISITSLPKFLYPTAEIDLTAGN